MSCNLHSTMPYGRSSRLSNCRRWVAVVLLATVSDASFLSTLSDSYSPQKLLLIDESTEQINFLCSAVFAVTAFSRAFNFNSVRCSENTTIRYLHPVEDAPKPLLDAEWMTTPGIVTFVDCPPPTSSISTLPVCDADLTNTSLLGIVCINEDASTLCPQAPGVQNCKEGEGVTTTYNVFVMHEDKCTYENPDHCIIAKQIFAFASISLFMQLICIPFVSPVGHFFFTFFQNWCQRLCYCFGCLCVLPNAVFLGTMLFFVYRTVEEDQYRFILYVSMLGCAYCYFVFVQIAVPNILQVVGNPENKRETHLKTATLHAMLNLPVVGICEVGNLSDKQAKKDIKHRRCMKWVIRIVGDIPRGLAAGYDWHIFGFSIFAAANVCVAGYMIVFHMVIALMNCKKKYCPGKEREKIQVAKTKKQLAEEEKQARKDAAKQAKKDERAFNPMSGVTSITSIKSWNPVASLRSA